MILDGHIHIGEGPIDNKKAEAKMKKAGVDGGVLLSIAPNGYRHGRQEYSVKERIDNLLEWTSTSRYLFPFFWINPIEEDALSQVDTACNRGVKGFKIICSNFYPSDARALEVYKLIAKMNKPILFHSGILYNNRASANYNKPAEFEFLMEIDGLKFALAHVSWPWCDENLAVYGKLSNARKWSGVSAEMYIDTTPGTPAIYREEVFRKIFGIGYDLNNNVFFGTDCSMNEYEDYSIDTIQMDKNVLSKLGIGNDDMEKYFYSNLKRFIGVE